LLLDQTEELDFSGGLGPRTIHLDLSPALAKVFPV
jgi:hypothetical protein